MLMRERMGRERGWAVGVRWLLKTICGGVVGWETVRWRLVGICQALRADCWQAELRA